MFGRKKERPISFFFSAKDGALHLDPDRLEKKGGGSVETLPLSQLEGVRLEDGEGGSVAVDPPPGQVRHGVHLGILSRPSDAVRAPTAGTGGAGAAARRPCDRRPPELS